MKTPRLACQVCRLDWRRHHRQMNHRDGNQARAKPLERIGGHTYSSGLDLETKIFSPSGRGGTFFLTSLFIEPTDDGLAEEFASRAARSRASKSRESHPSSSAGPTSVGHLADHASVSGSRLPGSSPDDPPGT